MALTQAFTAALPRSKAHQAVVATTPAAAPLRSYQQRLVEQLAQLQGRNAVLVAPTGSGKTNMVVEWARWVGWGGGPMTPWQQLAGTTGLNERQQHAMLAAWLALAAVSSASSTVPGCVLHRQCSSHAIDSCKCP